MMRIVIDANILLASIGSGAKYRRIFDALVTGRCCALLTTEILLEYAEVIGNRTRPVVAHNVLQALVNAPFSERITVYYRWNLILSDPDDNKFVDCAIAGNADYIITNDKHFAVLETIPFPRLQQISPEEFFTLL